MKGAIMLSGGGSGKLFAAIGVTYPAGSTLTCTNGTSTLKAKTTSGQWVFAIPKAGTWTVTVTDGTNSKSRSVSITSEGQFESVTLSYQLILFDGGDNTAVTGGWSANGHAISANEVEIGNNIGLDVYVSAGTDDEKSWMFATNNLIDVSGYSKLHVNLAEMSGLTQAQLCVTNEIAANNGIYQGANDPVAAVDASLGECVLDISSLNGTYHLGLWCRSNIKSYGNYQFKLFASKIWLE